MNAQNVLVYNLLELFPRRYLHAALAEEDQEFALPLDRDTPPDILPVP